MGPFAQGGVSTNISARWLIAWKLTGRGGKSGEEEARVATQRRLRRGEPQRKEAQTSAFSAPSFQDRAFSKNGPKEGIVAIGNNRI